MGPDLLSKTCEISGEIQTVQPKDGRMKDFSNMHFLKGSLEEAMAIYLEVFEIKRICLGNDSDNVANTLNNVAHLMFTLGRKEKSLKPYGKLLRIRQLCQENDCLTVGVTLGNMDNVYIKQSNQAMART
eukprot:2597003-Ditylum_brightwellii.AAC.1